MVVCWPLLAFTTKFPVFYSFRGSSSKPAVLPGTFHHFKTNKPARKFLALKKQHHIEKSEFCHFPVDFWGAELKKMSMHAVNQAVIPFLQTKGLTSHLT